MLSRSTSQIKHLGALREAGYRPRSVKQEIRDNLRARLGNGGPLFPGILGYDRTVIPSVINALLAGHDFILLGLRGQAKTRILRSLVTLLDEEVPVLAGTELNDDPLAPISTQGQRLVEEAGDDAPVEWLSREQRYNEKLATPDVSIADLLGDIDPIKAATRWRLCGMIGSSGSSLSGLPSSTGIHSSSSGTSARRRRLFAWPRRPRRMKSWRASSALTMPGTTVRS